MCADVENACGSLQPQKGLSESIRAKVIRRSHLGAASQRGARDEEDQREQCESLHREILRRDVVRRGQARTTPSHTQARRTRLCVCALEDRRHVIPVRRIRLGVRSIRTYPRLSPSRNFRCGRNVRSSGARSRMDGVAKSGGELMAGANSSTASDPSPVAG